MFVSHHLLSCKHQDDRGRRGEHEQQCHHCRHRSAVRVRGVRCDNVGVEEGRERRWWRLQLPLQPELVRRGGHRGCRESGGTLLNNLFVSPVKLISQKSTIECQICQLLLNTWVNFQLGKSPSLNRISIISQPKTSTTEDMGGSLAAPTVSQRVRKLSGNLFSRKKEGGQELYPTRSQQKIFLRV